MSVFLFGSVVLIKADIMGHCQHIDKSLNLKFKKLNIVDCIKSFTQIHLNDTRLSPKFIRPTVNELV